MESVEAMHSLNLTQKNQAKRLKKLFKGCIFMEED